MTLMNRVVQSGASWILCAVSAAAVAQVLPDSIRACKGESDDARRLQCYDRELAKYPMTAEQSYGLSQHQVAAAQQRPPGTETTVKTLTAKVVALRERPHAGFVVTFDNGQVWMQIEMESTRHVEVGDAVTIKPGWLGSFWLVGPTGWTTRVHRVQ
jgi:hypothetical protein